MKIIDTRLTPLDLFVNSKLDKPKFAILGTCVAEHLVNVGLLNNCEVSHYLMETWVNTPLPSVDWNKFDGVIVHITLRHIMDMAAGIGLGDISYIFRKGHEFDALAQQCIRIMKQRIDEIVSGIGAARPIFFLSFLEPPQTTRGFFENNRKDNIYRLIRDMNDSMADHLHLLNGAYYVETNDIANYFGVANGYDGYHNHFTHAGFFGSHEAESFYKTIIQRIIGALTTLRTLDSVKLIVTDLDNTLWKGVVAEEDEIVPWQHHEGWPIGYVEALLECKRRGVLLAICSKNDEDKTKENFRKVWGEKISLDDFCNVKINWNSKADNISQIIAEVNILPESVLFIDDNQLEIEEVKHAIPGIRTLSYPAENWRNILIHSPQLQSSHISAEARNKTSLIRAKIERDKSSQSMPRSAWLETLDLNLHFTSIMNTHASQFSRAFELLNKTNQFNTTGQRWSEEELSRWLDSGGSILAVNAEDRFANHGLISLALLKNNNFIQVVLSCRVFGLGIETALLSEAVRQMNATGYKDYLAHFTATGRNDACRDLWSSHGFVLDVETNLWQGSQVPNVPAWIKIS